MRKNLPSPYDLHEEALTLLPWYVNGSLKAQEMSLVKKHLQVCLVCRKEMAVLERLSERIRYCEAVELSPHSAFAHLLKRLENDGQPHQGSTPQRVTPSRSGTGISGRLFAALSRGGGWAVAAMMTLLLLVLPAFYWLMPASREPQYHTLANSGGVLVAGKDEIRVVFSQGMAPQQIKELLHAVHGQLVDGPTPTSVYTIRISLLDGKEQSIATALNQLRRQPGVLLAEPVSPAVSGDTQEKAR